MNRVGTGFDVHRFKRGRKLVLGGVVIPFERGLDGHSDADVLVHAIMDALLGALALGDIGCHFPDTDPDYAGADSIELLRRVSGLLAARGAKICNIDATILAEAPKMAPHIPLMCEHIAEAAGVAVGRVSVKATTLEKMGFIGRGEGIGAMAVAGVDVKDD